MSDGRIVGLSDGFIVDIEYCTGKSIDLLVHDKIAGVTNFLT